MTITILEIKSILGGYDQQSTNSATCVLHQGGHENKEELHLHHTSL